LESSALPSVEIHRLPWLSRPGCPDTRWRRPSSCRTGEISVSGCGVRSQQQLPVKSCPSGCR
jgi:hypothetical protein